MALIKGDVVKVRRTSDIEWTPAKVKLASGNGKSLMLEFDGAIRGVAGLFVGMLPLLVDYPAGKISGLDGQEYEIEITPGAVS